MEDVTVVELDNMVAHYFAMQRTKEDREAQVTAINKEIMALESKLVDMLKMLGRKDYRHPAGTVSIKQRWSVGLPQTDEDKAAFFAWLRERNIFEKYATVNSASLNSLWAAEREAAIRQDPTSVLTFNIVGLPAPRLFEGLSKRKGNSE